MEELEYEQAIEEFAENEDCSPVEDVVKNPACVAMAKRFGKEPDQVSRDINRHYIESYRPL